MPEARNGRMVAFSKTPSFSTMGRSDGKITSVAMHLLAERVADARAV
jgi:hypothetical protein